MAPRKRKTKIFTEEIAASELGRKSSSKKKKPANLAPYAVLIVAAICLALLTVVYKEATVWDVLRKAESAAGFAFDNVAAFIKSLFAD